MTKYFFKMSLLVLMAIFLNTSCSEVAKENETEPNFSESLTGNWEVSSFLEDGEELMQNLFSEFTMEFGPISGGKGFFKFQQVDVFEGNIETFPGSFSLNEDQKEITLISQLLNGGSETLNLDFNGADQLTMQGFVDEEEHIIITAVRIPN